MIRWGTGFAPAPIITNNPHSPMNAALRSPSQLRCARVRGRDNTNVAAEKIANKIVVHKLLSESTDRACCPERIRAPTEKTAKMMVPKDRISRPTGPNMMNPASPASQQ